LNIPVNNLFFYVSYTKNRSSEESANENNGQRKRFLSTNSRLVHAKNAKHHRVYQGYIRPFLKIAFLFDKYQTNKVSSYHD